jgi:dTDP-4-amino-4,6-dideoxygalactose transaminase
MIKKECVKFYMRTEKEIRREILKEVIEFFRLRKKKLKFIPGETLINYAGRVYNERELVNLVDASLDFWLTAGRYAWEFEKKLANFLGVKYCLLVNSGSSANLLAVTTLTSPFLKERRLKTGDEIITTACGFPTTLNPIIQNNLIPVFIDVDLGTYNIQVDKIERAISKKTKAISIAHTLGNPADIELISKIANKYKLWFIEDNCISADRCSVVKIDGHIQVMTIKEIYNIFKAAEYRSFEVLSHGDFIKQNDLNSLSDEFINMLGKRQLDILKLYKKYQGDPNKIVTKLNITKSSYYCRMWEIRRKVRNFAAVKFRWAKVKNVISKGNKNVLNITQNFGQTCVTTDHRIMVLESNHLSDKHTTDFISERNNFVTLLLTENADENIVDLAKYLRGYFQKNGSIKYDNNYIWFKYTKKCWKGKISELPRLKRYYQNKDLEVLCTLFGFYCSEGSCGHEVRISSTDYNDIKFIEKSMKSISNLKSIRISCSDRRKNSGIIRGERFKSNKVVYSVNMGHELINIVFSKLGGTNSYDKRVPNFIFNLKKKYIKIFYNYYIKGDGCRKSDDETDFVVTTASVKMAAGVNLLNNLVFKKYSRFVIAKDKYYDVSPVKSIMRIKKKVNRVESFKNAEVYDIVVEGTSTFVDACGNVLLHNCDALASKYRGRYTGTFGDISTCSFYPPHMITTGEGGAILTSDLLLKKIIISFRDWGRDCYCQTGHDNTCGKRFSQKFATLPFGYDHKYIYSHIGYNLKITDLQAAIGVAQLDKLPKFMEARRKNFTFLYNYLKDYEKFFVLPSWLKGATPCWFGFPILVKEDAPFKRRDIVDYLEKNKIATRMLFGGNLTKQPAYQNIKCRIFGSLKNTDLVMNNLFWIGVYPGLNKTKINYVLSKFDEFMREKLR